MQALKARAFLYSWALGVAMLGSVLEARSNATAAGVLHSTRVILLGTGGGPLDRAVRSQPATLLVVDGHPYLIDAGAGVVRRIAQAGWQPHRIDRIFMTHYHLDHDAGLEALMSFIWIDRNVSRMSSEFPVEIYGPTGTRLLARSALDFLSVSERIFSSEALTHIPSGTMFAAHRIAGDGIVYKDARVCVTAVENTHYHFLRGSPAHRAGDNSLAYRFDTVGGSVVFTGDTGPSAAVTRLAGGADLLVSEVIAGNAAGSGTRPSESRKPSPAAEWHMLHEHLTSQAVGQLAADAGVKAVLLTHLVPGLDDEHGTTIYTRGVHEYYQGPVIAGRDLFEYDLFARSRGARPPCR